MKLRQLWVSVCVSLSLSVYASSSPDFTRLFKNQEGCFLLYNLSQKQVMEVYNKPRCRTEIAPDSTFKIALSLMAFDSGLITQQTVFKWNGTHYSLPAWNQNQTPQTWLQNSVVWVSQTLTPELGVAKIQKYLQAFDYGNEDFSGDPGANNGLTHAWLESSLKISPAEQLKFLGKLLKNKLPVSAAALNNTKANLYLETSAGGWALYGKTGSGMHPKNQSDNNKPPMQNGWFMGWTQKGAETYLFVLNAQDLVPPATQVPAGMRAKNLAKEILSIEGVF